MKSFFSIILIYYMKNTIHIFIKGEFGQVVARCFPLFNVARNVPTFRCVSRPYMGMGDDMEDAQCALLISN